MTSARQGYAGWEIDITWMFLKMLETAGLVWDLRDHPRPRSQPEPLPLREAS